ncbi:MAG: serine/threonine protein kinase [Actinobacteria bacterium]|nr:MAG: serine/threonine protein kinase [Actinomycetota bacterium]
MTDEQRTERLTGDSAAHRRRRFEPPPASTERTREVTRDGGPVRGGLLVMDRYRLERRLGAGGFGVVWLAFDEKLEREVAVKVIPREDDEPVPIRAAREARVAARLNHPGIVSLYELGEDEDAVYLVSELVPGRTLADLIRAGALSDRDVARIGIALCDALVHAHGRKVIHRDVKPQNVIVVAEPAAGAGFAKLADFGVAHLAVADPLTRSGDVVGTLAYMAPEQAEGERSTPAVDVYALGLTLFEAWSGTNPVRGPTPAATARRLGRRLPSLSSYRRDLPYELCAWIDAALDPVPDRRPRLAVLRDALRDAAQRLDDVRGLSDAATAQRVGIPATTATRIAAVGPKWIGGPAAAVAARVAAGTGAGGLVLAGLRTLGPAPRFSAGAAAICAGVLVALLPRAGWLAVAGAFAGWLGWELRDGTALVVVAALAPVPLLLPRAGRAWSVPALAPLLGAVALGPAFMALAGAASTTARRIGLGAAGFIWVGIAELLTSQHLLFGPPSDATARAAWAGSLNAAGRDGLFPLVSSPAVVGIAVWAGLAALVPVLVRGRSLALDLVGAAVWATILVAAHAAIVALGGSDIAHREARGLVLGAILGGALLVAASAAGLLRGESGKWLES